VVLLNLYCCPFGVILPLLTAFFASMWCMAGGLPGNAALTLLRCRRRRARPDLGDSQGHGISAFRPVCALLPPSTPDRTQYHQPVLIENDFH
jgi:hypothetical protein